MYSRQLHSRQLRSQLLPIREYRRDRQIIVKPEVIVKVSAIYLDTQGTEYSCYVTRTDHGFMLATAHGLRPITFYIEGSDVAGGYVQFLDYRFERQPGLRVCDYFYSMNRLRAQLPWPQKPAQPPIPQVQPEDFRLHVEEAGDSFRVLQEASNLLPQYDTGGNVLASGLVTTRCRCRGLLLRVEERHDSSNRFFFDPIDHLAPRKSHISTY